MSLQEVSDALKLALETESRPSLLVEVTASSGCNKRCSYCFESNHEVKFNKVEQDRQIELLKELCTRFDTSKLGRLQISFWGGEPMLNLGFVREVIESTMKWDFVDWHVFTNGTLASSFKDLVLDEKISKKLKHGRLSVQISFDGEPHHTLKRGYSSSEFEEVAELLDANGIMFNFKGTIAIDSIDLMPACWDSYCQMYQRFPRNAWWTPTIDTSANASTIDLDIWKKVLVDIAKREYKFIKENGRPLLSWFSDSKRFCDVRMSTHMHSDGNFYLCHGAPYIEDATRREKFITGKTFEVSSILEVIYQNQIDASTQPEQCKHCGATYCGACHINMVDPDNIYSDWRCSIARDVDGRCKLMKIFGEVSRMLRLSLATSGFLAAY